MNKTIAVLGAGRVGSAIALDLADQYTVTVGDRDEKVLTNLKQHRKSISTQKLDVTSQKELSEFLNGANLVVCAVPGFLGYETLQAVIECGRNVVDISFSPEDVLNLDKTARKKGVTAIVDCGVAPGLDNILLGYHDERMDVQQFECLVGGLPKEQEWPFSYKAPFSPVDVLEEYTRPARFMEGGKLKRRPALTDPELVTFEGVGTLEAFNTDGLRSLLHTMDHIPDMKEKTLRYPGHREQILALKMAGFLDADPVELKGHSLSPMDFTAKILMDNWQLNPGDEEFTVMRVTIEGKRNGEPVKIEYELFDEYDKKTKTTSMARTTGYTATAAANMLMEGHFSRKGVHPPENIGRDADCFAFIMDYLEERGVQLQKSEILGQ